MGYKSYRASLSIALFLFLLFSALSVSIVKSHNIGHENSITDFGLARLQPTGTGILSQISPPQQSKPAPMGIADFGFGPNGSYEYVTKSFIGTITLRSLSTVNDSSLTIQLNVFFSFTANGTEYAYWIQNIASLWPSMKRISFGNYIFNASGYPNRVDSQGLSGNGQVLGEYSCYQCYNSSLPGQNVQLVYPATTVLNLTSGVDSAGHPFIGFSYSDGYGLITYDLVTFNVTGVASCGFKVSRMPGGLFTDSELVLCGPGAKVPTTSFIQSDLQLQLEYWNGHNYQSVSNAYNFGTATAESTDNVVAQAGFYPDNGTLFANINAGNGSLGVLFTQDMIGTINMKSTSSGTLCIVNASNGKSERQCEFSQGEVTINVFPGYYNLKLYQNGLFFDQGNFTVNAGQKITFQAQTDTPMPTPPPVIPEFPSFLPLIITTVCLGALLCKKKLKPTHS
jgi:hypothetical protein